MINLSTCCSLRNCHRLIVIVCRCVPSSFALSVVRLERTILEGTMRNLKKNVKITECDNDDSDGGHFASRHHRFSSFYRPMGPRDGRLSEPQVLNRIRSRVVNPELSQHRRCHWLSRLCSTRLINCLLTSSAQVLQSPADFRVPL